MDRDDDAQAAAEELLLRGRESARQLRQLLLHTSVACTDNTNHINTEQDVLMMKILHSFTNSLSILNGNVIKHDNSVEVVSPCRLLNHMNSPSSISDAARFEDSGDRSSTPFIKGRRGCYKRRKTSHSWSREMSTLIDDGHAWRKYGQKPILKATHPRNYFRCTHKYDQKCEATKHVQRMEGEPPKFRTTYYGHHTCTNLLRLPTSDDDDHDEIIRLNSVLSNPYHPESSDTILISFNTTSTSTTPNNHHLVYQ